VLATAAALVASTAASWAAARLAEEPFGGLLVVPNAIGAWLVPWLQTAAADAYAHFYVDATVGGIAIALVVGAAVGALFSSVLDRLPQDHPVVWGALGGLMIWAFTWWRVLPALDPALVSMVERSVWLIFCLAYGHVLGVWVSGERVAGRALPELGPVSAQGG
jgi:hypothetical protein